jgi:Novel STAND NTPase 1
MASTNKPAEVLAQRPLAAALGHATSDVKGIATLILTVATVPAAFVALRDAVHLPSPWPEIGCVVPIAIFVAFYFIPEWRVARDRKALEDFGVTGEPPPAGYFRLTAYGLDERAKFERPDGAEGQVLKWVQRSNETFLYLVGLSGVGKSSLLSAHVIPALKESGTVVIEARPYDDPIGAITRALCKPGAVWKQPPAEETDVRNLLERAATAVARTEKRLLIVLDQFEEVLILLGDEARQPFSELLKSLQERPVENLTILLSLRLDYIGGLEALPIPPPTYGTNWFEVKRFTPPAARRFIEHSDLKPGPKLVEQILKEAAEIEDSLDQVRPVVVNMYGLVLASFKGRLPTDMVPGRLLSGYVRRSLDRADLKEVSRAVIAPLVTDVGTKRARPLNEIAAKASVSTARARGALLRLAEDGLVRAVDKAGQHWEVAHDFVARLVLPLLESAHSTWWGLMRPWLAPGAIVMWAAIIAGGAIVYPDWHQANLRVRLANLGFVSAPPPSANGIAFQYNGAPVSEDQLTRAFELLEQVYPPVTSIASGAGFPSTVLSRVPHLPKTLTHLDLSNSDGIDSLEGISNLISLTDLTLSRMPKLKSLASLPKLPALARFTLDNSSLVSLRDMPILENLKVLALPNADRLRNFSGMPQLDSLQVFDLNSSWGFESLAGMPTFPNLVKLNLSESRLETLQDSPAFLKLRTLFLPGRISFQRMPIFPALREIDISPSYSSEENGDLTPLELLPVLEVILLHRDRGHWKIPPSLETRVKRQS